MIIHSRMVKTTVHEGSDSARDRANELRGRADEMRGPVKDRTEEARNREQDRTEEARDRAEDLAHESAHRATDVGRGKGCARLALFASSVILEGSDGFNLDQHPGQASECLDE